MKIWHLLSNRWNSAITEYALSLAQSLKEYGGADSVFTPLAGSPAEVRAKKIGLRVEPLPSFSLLAWIKLQKIWRKEKPQKIICYGGQESFLISYGKQFFDSSPQAIRFMGDLHFTRSHPKIFSITQRMFDGHLIPSECVATKLVQWLGEKKRIHKIPLGIDIKKYSFQDIPITPQVLMVSRLDPIKGHEKFLSLFARALKEFPWTKNERPKLLILGEEANLLADDIHRFAAQSNLVLGQDYELLTMRHPRVEGLMAASCLGVVPSLGSEFIARVSQEFLAVGTRLFVHDVGSLRETLGNFSGDSFSFADQEEALQKLVSQIRQGLDDSMEVRIARAKRGGEVFCFEKMAKDFFKIFP